MFFTWVIVIGIGGFIAFAIIIHFLWWIRRLISPISSYRTPEIFSNLSSLKIVQDSFDHDTLTRRQLSIISDIPKFSSSIETFHELRYFTGINEIPDYTFSGNKTLLEISLPINLTSIGNGAFLWCERLREIDIPKTVSNIGRTAFLGCRSLSGINVSTHNLHFKSIEGVLFDCKVKKLLAFPPAKNIRNYIIPDTVVEIADGAFAHCSHLWTISLPSSIKSIGYQSFIGCSALNTITIPEGVESIESDTFAECTKLKKLYLPNSVKKISGSALKGCNNLSEIIVSSQNIYFSTQDGVLYNHDRTVLIKYPCGKNTASYIIPQSVSEIGEYAFYKVSSLHIVLLPNNLKKIGVAAFSSCSSLYSIAIPDSVNEIGVAAFEDCNNLSKCKISSSIDAINSSTFRETSLEFVNIPDGVKKIGHGAFSYCKKLRSVIIPKSVEDIDSFAFTGCQSVEKYIFSCDNPPILHEDDFTSWQEQSPFVASIPSFPTFEGIEGFKIYIPELSLQRYFHQIPTNKPLGLPLPSTWLKYKSNLVETNMNSLVLKSRHAESEDSDNTLVIPKLQIDRITVKSSDTFSGINELSLKNSSDNIELKPNGKENNGGYTLGIEEDTIEHSVLEIVNYQLDLECIKGCYPLLTVPSFGCTIWPYRRGITFRRGFTETSFENELKHEFGNQVLVLGDVQLLFASESRPFEPDIALIYRGKCNLRIDLEIDEPYDGLTHCPSHYLGCNDSFRDEMFGSHGWLVIRFSERQIHEQRNECLAFIGRLFKAADSDFILNSELQAFGDLQPEPCWTQLEAQKMAEEDLRETYLGHSFKYKEVTEFPTLTVLSDYEEKLIEENNFNAPSYCNREVFSFGLSTEEEFNDETLNSVGYNKKNSSPLDVDICFDAYKHLYTYKGIPFKAVSSLVSEFFPVFDMPYWSSVKAQERNISQQYVIEQWTAEGNKSKEVGTFLHKQIENYLLGKKTETDYYFKYCGDEFSVEETISIESEFGFFLNFLNDNKVEPYRTEWRIYDKEYHIAGTIDMICKNNSGGFDIYDWKRSKRLLDDNPFQSGLGELSELEDTRKNHYLLQQNLYKFILEKNYGLRIDSMHLIGLHPIIADNYVDIKLDSVKSYVEYMLKNSNNL